MTTTITNLPKLPRAAFVTNASSHINTKHQIASTILRVRILDCRSGSRVVGEEIMIDKAIIIDLEKEFELPISLPKDGFKAGNRIGLQKVMEALEYPCGKTPTAQFGDDGKNALKNICYHLDPKSESNFDSHFEKWKSIKEKEKLINTWLDDKGWQKKIVEAYNNRFYKTINYYLTMLNYACDPDDTWGEKSQQAFKDYQKEQAGEDGTITIDQEKSKGIIISIYQVVHTITSITSGTQKTNQDGELEIPVTQRMLEDGYEFEIEMKNFPIVRKPSDWDENEIKELKEKKEWKIEWKGPQKEPNWGWTLNGHEFQSKLKITVAAKMKSNKSEIPPIIIYALVWCQPVWDKITDPDDGKMINEKVYVQANGNQRNGHMHIVTSSVRCQGTNNSGKGYGFFENEGKWRQAKNGIGHDGIDLYAKCGTDRVFAIHGGILVTRKDGFSKDRGNYVELIWNNQLVRYLHLSEYIKKKDKNVKSGEIIGKAGRTGEGFQNTPYAPDHVHFAYENPKYIQPKKNPSTIIDGNDPNFVCIPNNDKTPLLLPCAAGVSQNYKPDPTACLCNNSEVINSCWAVDELVCPYLKAETTKKIYRWQAQLRYIQKHYKNEKYMEIKKIVSDVGPVPTLDPEAISNYEKGNNKYDYRKIPDYYLAIRYFNEHHGYCKSFKNDYQLDEAARQKLDELTKDKVNNDINEIKNDDQLIQSKLKTLFKKSNEIYLDPGELDGKLGIIPEYKSNLTISKSRMAIRAFMQQNGFPKENHETIDNEYESGKEALRKLNELAPIPES